MTNAFFDTNVLIYLFQAEENEKRGRAYSAYNRHRRAGGVVLSAQVLNEFFAVVTRKTGLAMKLDAATAAVESLATNKILPLNVDLTFAAIARSRVSRFSFWDALIVEAALAGRAEVLYTEDLQHGQIIDGLRVENPFLN